MKVTALTLAVAGLVLFSALPRGDGAVRVGKPQAGATRVDSTVVDCPDCMNPYTNPDRREDKSHLTVASFNAEWLFDGKNGDKHIPWSGPDEAHTHMERVAAAIQRLNADIVNVVEVEGCFMLQEVADRIPGGGYSVCVKEGRDTYLRQQVGLMTRLQPVAPLKRSENRVQWPLVGNRCGFNGKGKAAGVSKHYYTVFSVAGLPKEVLVVGAHFKAIPNQPVKCAEREAQATVIRDIVAEEGLGKNRFVIVMGDLNDFESKVPDAINNSPNSRVFDILRNIYPDVGQDELINVSELLPQAERITNWYDRNHDGVDQGVAGGEHSMIDHILISRELKQYVQRVWVDRSDSMNNRVSDHWPIAFTLSTPMDDGPQ